MQDQTHSRGIFELHSNLDDVIESIEDVMVLKVDFMAQIILSHYLSMTDYK